LIDIIAIYCPPLPRLLLPVPLLISCRALSLPPSPASTLTSSEIGQQRMGGSVRLMARRNRWTVVAAAAMGIVGRHDGRWRRRWATATVAAAQWKVRRWRDHNARHRDCGGRRRRRWAVAVQWAAGRQGIHGRAARLHIPVFMNLFFGSKKMFLTGFLRIFFFPAFSGGIFHSNVVLERSQEFRFFSDFTGIFHQEFLWAVIPVLLRIPQDSGGFRRIPVPAKD